MNAKILKIIRIFCIVILILTMSSSAFATLIVDGKFDSSEGYTTGHYVNFDVEAKKSTTPFTGTKGQFWTHQDSATNDLYIAFIQPLDLVDNSYGDNSVGWCKGIAPSGKNHNFKDPQAATKHNSCLLMGLTLCLILRWIISTKMVLNGNQVLEEKAP